MPKKVVDMTNGPLFSKIVVFVIPLLFSNLLQRLYNMADMLVVGKFAGSNSLAAVGATGSFVNLILNILLGISIGVSAVIAQDQGAGDKESVKKALHTSMAISVFGSIIIAATGTVICRPVLGFMGTPDTIIDKSVLYMIIILAGYPASSIFNFGSAILRAKGDTKSPFVFLAISGLLNVILNLFFVIVCKMDVAGVAVSTIISQVFSAIMVMNSLSKDEYPYKFLFKEVKIHMAEFKKIIAIGLPIALQSSVFSASNMIIQSAVNSFGENAVAGAAAASNVDAILYVMISVPQYAATIFTGQNFGANKPDRILKVLLICCLIVMILGIPFGAIFLLFGKAALGLFTNNSEVVEYGYKVLVVIASTYFICGIMDTISGSLKGLNKSVQSMISSITGLVVVRIMWVYTYFAAHRDLSVLYMSFPLSWIFVTIVNTVIFTYSFKKIKKQHALEEATF
ncbi:MAG: MATE family efflux transporter [Monoglobales bacterium]